MNYEGHLSEDRFKELLALPKNHYAWRFLLYLYDGLGTFHGNPTRTLVYLSGTKILGFFRYWVSKKGRFEARGTWVTKQHRGTGLGGRLWQRALQGYPPDSLTLDVITVSKGGKRLVRSAMDGFKFKHVKHYAYDGDGDVK